MNPHAYDLDAILFGFAIGFFSVITIWGFVVIFHIFRRLLAHD